MQEIVSLEQNRKALKFPYMVLGGLLISLIVGVVLDSYFKTSPLILLGLIFYTIIGSFLILVKDKKKS